MELQCRSNVRRVKVDYAIAISTLPGYLLIQRESIPLQARASSPRESWLSHVSRALHLTGTELLSKFYQKDLT